MNESAIFGILLLVIPLIIVLTVVLTWHSFVGRLVAYARSQRQAKRLGR